MRRAILTLILAGALVPGGLPARAADPIPGRASGAKEQEQRLERAYEEVARRDLSTKGSVHPELQRQKREIRALIRRLEAGDTVAPGEVDRVLQAE